jgi:hypothetical protein
VQRDDLLCIRSQWYRCGGCLAIPSQSLDVIGVRSTRPGGLSEYRNRQDDFTFDTANFSPTNYVTQFQIEMVDLKSGEVMATRIFDTAVVVTRSGTYRLLVRSSFVSLSTSLACSQQQHQHQERLNTQVETATKKKNERRRNDTTVRCVLWLVSNDIFVGAGESSISITIF